MGVRKETEKEEERGGIYNRCVRRRRMNRVRKEGQKKTQEEETQGLNDQEQKRVKDRKKQYVTFKVSLSDRLPTCYLGGREGGG